MFRSNVSSTFLHFVGKVFDENTGKGSTRVNGWQYLRCMSIRECINYLVQVFTGRCQSYSFIVKSNNNPVNYMTTPVSGLINDLDKVLKIKSSQSAWLVIVVDCQSGYSYNQQDKQVMGGCLCNQEGQPAVQ